MPSMCVSASSVKRTFIRSYARFSLDRGYLIVGREAGLAHFQITLGAAHCFGLIRPQTVLAFVAGDVGEENVGCGVLLVLWEIAERFDGLFKQIGHLGEY